MADEKQPGGRNTDAPQYDPGIVPQEVKARKEREGSQFGSTTQEQSPGSINTTGGATVDQEGLANNYAIEPEMYVETPGDLRQEEEAAKAKRVEELEEIKHDEGDLSAKSDTRSKGPGKAL